MEDAVSIPMSPRAAQHCVATVTLPASYTLNGSGLQGAVLIPSITALTYIPTQCRYLWITDETLLFIYTLTLCC